MSDIKVSVLIHTRNEEENIQDAIASAQILTHQIIVVDMQSTDDTAIIAQKMGVNVYQFPHSTYVEPARNFGIEKATTDWVFIMDADERMTQSLASEIKEVVEQTEKSYFKLPRKNIFGRVKWLEHGGWYPDYVIRLIKKKSFVKWPTQIHSSPIIRGEMGYLLEPLTHYFHSNLTGMVQKTGVYENIESDLLFEAKRDVSTLILFRKFFGELNRRLIMSLGFTDGIMGLIESLYQAYSKTITYIFLYEKYKKSRSL